MKTPPRRLYTNFEICVEKIYTHSENILTYKAKKLVLIETISRKIHMF